MSFNRKPITIRLNLKEQQDLRALGAFWGVDERKALKIAFEQFVTATNQMQKKLQQENTNEHTETDTAAGGGDGTVVGADSAVSDDAGTAATASQPADADAAG